MMVYTGKWHRRSGVMTLAEWIPYRFGEGAGSQFARVFTAFGAIALSLGMLAYMIKGVGSFLTMFLPFSPIICALIMVSIATVYTMASGFYGVVVTDVIQTVIIFLAVGVIATMAVLKVNTIPDLDAFAEDVTQRDFVRNEAESEVVLDKADEEDPPIRTEWTSSKPAWNLPMQQGYGDYSLLTLFALFYLMKNLIEGGASGGDPRYFGARNERECGLLSAMWGGLIMIRWPMMMGFALLGLLLVQDLFGDSKNEQVWQANAVIKQYALDEALADGDLDDEIAAGKIPDISSGYELDLTSAIVAERLIAKQYWTDPDTYASTVDAQKYEKTVSRLEKRIGQDWRGKLTELAMQEKILKLVAPKERWGEIVSRAGSDRSLEPRLKEILGEKQFDTKLNLISYEGTIHAERILPAVLLHRIQPGIRGLLLVALLAASMSTFDTNVNMSTGFFTRDLYQRYFRPRAKNRELILASYAFGVALVAFAFLFAIFAENINDIWGWIIMSLTAGKAVPLVLRLYWWRFNAGGVVASSVVGLGFPFIQRIALKDMHEWNQFLWATGIAVVAAIIGTFVTQPTDRKTLEHFYKTTRPFGFWGPLKNSVPEILRKKMRIEHRNDMIAIPFVMTWQVTLYMLGMQLIIRSWDDLAVTLVIHLIAVAGVYKFWYKNLPPKREGVPTEAEIEAGQI
jgi:Na+/proline symporter